VLGGGMRVGGMPHIIGKFLMKVINFLLEFITIEGLNKKLWDSKVMKIPRQNDIWVQPS
jgi:hypothetical protein